MALRRNGIVLLSFLVFVTFTLILLNARPGDDTVLQQIYEQRLNEALERLRYAEKQNQARSQELYRLKEQIAVAFTDNRVSHNNHTSNATVNRENVEETRQRLQRYLADGQNVQLPSVLHYMPHLQHNLDGLVPAFLMSQGRVGDRNEDVFRSPLTDLSYIEQEAELIKDRWRTKQNLDFSFLMMYAQVKATFYVQLEDDIIAKPGYITTMNNFALQQKQDDWFMLEFSSLGFIGKLFKTSDLNLVIEFFLMFHRDKPIDWLLDHILWVKVCHPEKDVKHCAREKAALRIRFKPSLFQHVGMHSSLPGKVQKLKDKDFGKQPLHRAHENPTAQVSTTIKVYMKYSLEKAYKGQDFFWGVMPKAGDVILFKFTQPIIFEKYRFTSGNTEHPGDVFSNTTVELLPHQLEQKQEGLLEIQSKTKSSYKRTADGYYEVGQFIGGKAGANIDSTLGAIDTLRLRVLTDAKAWVILSE
ncbi:alpha-1,3-mannosyl-glycoprotein 4-beta-N-acetylglucosaminyltransferase B-like, partial [Saccoglossus kowalevskii]|uniref:Alpha-1,3-mannosyl-glycoprotein 4-beta-N-acetylglucosaminyltransferase B-like n=1 Tax=Saccoglossus kowalevskii TaxID=10224 RepID=A0ABM0M6Q4_SACKO